jgi:hypothetical protein
MANALLTINMITREAIRLFKNSNAFLMQINRQYDGQFAREGAKIGTALRIRLPNDYVVTTGPALSVQDTAEQSVSIAVATQKHVDVGFSSLDRTMSLDDASDRVIAPMVNNLAGSIAADVMSGVEGGVSNLVFNGAISALTTPVAATFLGAGAALNANSAPMGDRKVVQSPQTEAKVVAGLAGLFNPSSEISKQYRTGSMGRALGFEWMMDQTTLVHTAGSAATATVSGAGQTGSTLVISALSGTLVAGDIITIAGVNGVNRVTKQDTGSLQQFVVTANVANGATSIPVYPAIVPSSGGNAVQFQTVTVSPANSATVTNIVGASVSYRKNVVFAPEAVTMVTADLYMPEAGVIEATRMQSDSIAMRFLSDYLPGSDQAVSRLDVLYGYKYIRPEWACIVADTLT